MHPILKNLFKTFIISTVLTIGANCMFYAYKMQGIRYDHEDTGMKMAGGTLILTTILLIMSLPSLFLIFPKYWKTPFIGFLLYFSGPIVFIIAFVFMKLDPTDQLFGQLTGLIYLAVTTLFYYLLSRDYRRKFGYTGNMSKNDRVNSRIDPS